MKFEGTRIFTLPFKNFKQGAAVTVPCIGIFVGKGFETDTDLLRHEFGHVLQFRKWGAWMFWKHVAPVSLKSARKSRKHNTNHMDTWTEWSANKLAYDYFGKPLDWNFHAFPIEPLAENRLSVPNFTAAKKNVKDWLDI